MNFGTESQNGGVPEFNRAKIYGAPRNPEISPEKDPYYERPTLEITGYHPSFKQAVLRDLVLTGDARDVDVNGAKFIRTDLTGLTATDSWPNLDRIQTLYGSKFSLEQQAQARELAELRSEEAFAVGDNGLIEARYWVQFARDLKKGLEEPQVA